MQRPAIFSRLKTGLRSAALAIDALGLRAPQLDVIYQKSLFDTCFGGSYNWPEIPTAMQRPASFTRSLIGPRSGGWVLRWALPNGATVSNGARSIKEIASLKHGLGAFGCKSGIHTLLQEQKRCNIGTYVPPQLQKRHNIGTYVPSFLQILTNIDVYVPLKLQISANIDAYTPPFAQILTNIDAYVTENLQFCAQKQSFRSLHPCKDIGPMTAFDNSNRHKQTF